MPEIHLYLFGYPRMELDGQPVEADTRKAVALLAYLAVTGEPQSRDVLAGLFWPDYDQAGARAALRRTLSVLNKVTAAACLEISRERVQIAAGAPLWLDVRAFLDGLARCQAAAAGGRASLDVLAGVVSLARDRFMAGFALRDAPEFDDWQFFQSETLSRELSTALEKLARGYAAQGAFDKALEYARTWLAQDTLLEDAHRLLMLLYDQSGQRNAALRQYRECVRILDQELGVAPLPETTELYQSIIENRLQPVEEQQDFEAAVPSTSQSQVEPAPSGPYPLVGRDQEQELLRSTYESVRGSGRLILLEGEAGIGKTRLAEEFLAWAREQGARILSLRAYEGETGMSYGPFVNGLAGLSQQLDLVGRLARVSPPSLAEAVRLVPEIGQLFPALPASPPIEGPGAQSRFFESLRQVLFTLLAGMPPGILFLDDLQWADTASLDLLAYLLRRLSGSAVLVLATWRSDLSVENTHLSQMINDLQRAGSFHRLTLTRLTTGQIEHLAAAAAGEVALPPDFGRRLYQETEGLPFFVVEYLQSILAAGSEASGNWEVPASVRDVLQHRLAGLDETARQLLSTAAVIGRSFAFETLREVSGRSEMETIAGLETLLARGVIVERAAGAQGGADTYDFTHARLRELAYEETSLARRRLLHRRTAEALLAEAGRHEPGPVAGRVAQHYLLAGQNELAAAYYRQAGDYARGLYANIDALSHYQAAVAAGHPDLAGLHEAVGDLRTLLGEYRAAIQSYEAAASMCYAGCLFGLERKLGNIHARLGNWDLAESHYRAALDADGTVCGGCQQAGIYTDWSHVAYQRGDTASARRLADQALQMAESSADPLSLAGAHNIAAILARARGDDAGAIQHLEQTLQIAAEQGSEVTRIAALNNLARAYAGDGRLEEALDLARDALAACQRLGDRHREAALLNNLADLLHTAGREEESMEYLKQAVTIFAEIGVEAGPENIEIWKLSEW